MPINSCEAQKVFGAFIFQLSGLALVAPSCFALQVSSSNTTSRIDAAERHRASYYSRAHLSPGASLLFWGGGGGGGAQPSWASKDSSADSTVESAVISCNPNPSK